MAAPAAQIRECARLATLLHSTRVWLARGTGSGDGGREERTRGMRILIAEDDPTLADGLVRSLRELSDYKSIPILLLTTESSDTMKQQGRAAGATGWLVKPFDPATLLEVVKKVLR